MTIDPYAWRAPQIDEPSILTADGRTIFPLNLGAVLPKEPINPLARLIPSQTPMRRLERDDGTLVSEVVDEPLSRGALDLIARAKHAWALRELRARGVEL